ncbi:unnamed protein product [Discosporangium mesarthrocarpum]
MGPFRAAVAGLLATGGYSFVSNFSGNSRIRLDCRTQYTRDVGCTFQSKRWRLLHNPGHKRPRSCMVETENMSGIDPTSPLPSRLQDIVDRLEALPDVRTRSVRLVELGDEFAQSDRFFSLELGPPESTAKRVPGCLSEVYVAVDVAMDESGGRGVVTVRGTSDARLSRGLLALLADGLSGESPATVLRLDGKVLATAVGLPAGLTDSRINGLRNILATVQGQVQEKMGTTPTPHGKVEALGAAIASPPQGGGHRERRGDELGAGEEEVPSPIPEKGEEVAVLLSGGVDSSVALRLLIDQGYRPRAFYLKIWLEDELAHLGECPWEEDLEYAEAVCRQCSVPLEVVSLQKEYWEHVVAYTVREAREGRTPNPDVMCNSRIKFGMFYDYIGKRFSRVATGHYAQVVLTEDNSLGGDSINGPRGPGQVFGSVGVRGQRARLLRSPDNVKDQTYFLCALSQEQLRKALFPIGGYTKAEIRELAKHYNLPTKSRKDSQGICFLGKLKFDDFLRHYLGEFPGPVVDYHTGEQIGTHRGLWFHTIGQRKGIGPVLDVGQVNRGPWYVARKDIPSNTLQVTNKLDAIDGPRESFEVEGLRWVSGRCPDVLAQEGRMELQVKTRHGPTSQDCTLECLPEALLPGSPPSARAGGRVRLAKRDSGLAPGQFAALYLGDECLGAGVISDSIAGECHPLPNVRGGVFGGRGANPAPSAV